ncbi:MAG: hypothetical protein ACTIIT_14955, partial [Brevibacterium linens]
MNVNDHCSPRRPCRSPGRQPIRGDPGKFGDMRDFLDSEFSCSGEGFRQFARVEADLSGHFAVVNSRVSDGGADTTDQRFRCALSTIACRD